jgi:peptidoglycan/xylan/chitin deacetylase (PgdA/CDA1 family)
MSDGPGPAGTNLVPRPAAAPLGRRLPLDRRLVLLLMAGVLVLAGLVAAWLGQRATAQALSRPGIAWSLSPASNTVTIRLTPGAGPSGRQVVADSHLVVSEHGTRHLRRTSPDGGKVRIPVPPGGRTRLVVLVKGPQPLRRTLTVTVPPRLRVVVSRTGSSGLLIRASSPVRHRPSGPLCGTNTISFPASAEVAVARSPARCKARLRLTALDGERAVVPVNIPALPAVPLYDTGSPAGQAIYITVNAGSTPSPQLLNIMRRAHVPVTAFLSEQAAQRNLLYWRAFTGAGGTIGNYTVSAPDLTKLTLSQAVTQWGQAQEALGRWFGPAPLIGRPPSWAINRTVRAAAYQGGLKALVGMSAMVNGNRIRTWNGKGPEPGEIVLLHWTPDLGHQLSTLLAAIQSRHLHPRPLTPASFAGVTPQAHSLAGGQAAGVP